MSFDRHCSFWPKTATFEISQRSYLYHSITTVHFGQRQLYLNVHREAICINRPPLFILAKDSNIWKFTERLFVSFGHFCSLWPKTATLESSQRGYLSFGHHSSLWSKTATFESSQRGYLCHSTTTVHCSQRQQHLKVHREAIHGQRPP